MKKTFLLILCLCLFLCGCTRTDAPAAETKLAQIPITEAPEPETTLPEAETAPPETSIETTAPAETAAPTKPVRLPGPDVLEGNSVIIQNVTVDTTRNLPNSITSSSAYRYSGNKADYVLDDSRIYAVIQFSITNKTEREIGISDINDDFMVEMMYADNYIYSSDSDSACFFNCRSRTAIVCQHYSIGKVALSPLASGDVTVYIPCAAEVFEHPEENLSVIYSSNYSGFEALEFVIR